MTFIQVSETTPHTGAADRDGSCGRRRAGGADNNADVGFIRGPRPLLDRAKLRELPSSPEQRFWLLQELAGLLEAAALAGPWTHRCSCSSVRRLAVDVPGESGGVLDEEFA